MTRISMTARLPIAELMRFGFVGVLSNVVYFGALYVLSLAATLPLWLTGALSYALSMLVNYVLQRRVTFRSTRAHGEASARYLVVQLVGLTLNSVLLELLVVRLGLPFLLGQGIALAVTMTWSYAGQKTWVFRSTRPVLRLSQTE